MDSQGIMVSIMVITYNHEKYLKQALESILMQEVNFKYEIVVGEDCSPDNSRDILKEYENKYPGIFRMIYREKNIGATRNFYDTLMKCKGKYIAYLEGDDYWSDKNKLNIQVEFLENNLNYIGAYHLVNVSDNEEKIKRILPDSSFLQKNNMEEISSVEEFMNLYYQTMGQIFHIQSLVYRNIFFQNGEQARLMKLFTSTKYICDLQLKLLVINSGKIKLINMVMGNYRFITQKGGKSFSSQNILMHYHDIKTVWELIDEYFDYKYGRKIKDIIFKEKYMVTSDRIKNKDIKSALCMFRNELTIIDKMKFIVYLNKKALNKIVKINTKN